MRSFGEVSYEYFNVHDKETLRILTTVNEEDQGQILQSLTSKLYDAIVKKVDDIDYGGIPSTRGDITRLQNYEELVDSTNLMKDIVSHYKQNTSSIQIVLDAIDNIKSRTSLWKKGYNTNIEFPCIIYETMVLSVVSSISFLISSCIEYIKSSDNSTFEISLDKVSYAKSKNSLLLKNLDHFNKSCTRYDLDKAINYLFDTVNKGEIKEAVAVGIGMGIVAFTVVITSILPYIRELIYFFYLTKQNISDYFELQANLLQMNISNIQYSNTEDKEDIIRKQSKIVDLFRKISNIFSIKFKKEESNTMKEINSDKRKYNIDDVIDEMPDSASPSSIF